MSDIYTKSKKGFVWTTAGNVVKGLLGFLTLGIMTYYLGPSKMGLVSIIGVVYGLSESLVEFGISQSIVSNDESTDEELSSIFWTNQLIGIIVTIAIFFLAPLIANFYEQPELLSLVRYLSLIFMIEPLDMLFRAILQKKMEFALVEKVDFVKTSTIFLVTFGLILLGQSVQSYVLALLVATVCSLLIFSYRFLRDKIWFPRFHFKVSEIEKHYKFGIYVTGKSVLNYIGRNFDELIVGKIVGVEALGLYYFAKKIIDKPTKLVASSMRKVVFPMFSNLRGDIVKCKKAYLNITRYSTIFSVGLFGGTILTSYYVISIFFGGDWTDATTLMQIFALIAFIDLVSGGFAISLIYAFRDSKFLFMLDLYWTPIRLLIVALASFYSLELVVLSYLLGVIIKAVILQVKVNKLITLQMDEYIATVSKPVLAGIVLVPVGLLCIRYLNLNSDIIKFLIVGGIFTILYSLYIFYFDRNSVKAILSEIGSYNIVKVKQV